MTNGRAPSKYVKRGIQAPSRPGLKKKIGQHAQKVQRVEKRNKALNRMVKKKSGSDAKAPNLGSHKKNLLEELKRRKRGRTEKIRNLSAKGDSVAITGPREDDEETAQVQKGNQDEKMRENRAHFKSLNFVIENADIILEVLDARDPEGCRCRPLERKLAANHPDKKLVLVLNKIDLVPLEIVQRWKAILSREYPTILFKANVQEQKSGLGGASLFANAIERRPDLAEELLASSKSVGSDRLLELVKNYARTESGVKNSVSVGVVGYPNVGKSSVINSLARRRAAGVSSEPGFTRNVRRIDIDSGVEVLDCPGVVPSSEDEITLLLRNTIKAHQVGDLDKAIAEIIRKAGKEQLIKLYKVEDFETSQEFNIKVAEVRGRYKKGGMLDLETSARTIIHDWCEGKIKYYTVPPEYEFERPIVAMSMETE